MNTDLPLLARLDAPCEVSPERHHVAVRGLDRIREGLTYLTSLEMGPVPWKRFMTVEVTTFFRLHMPALRNLSIRATHESRRRIPAINVPRPNLFWENLPSLRTLVLDGVGLPSTGILGYGLSRLELRNYPSEENQLCLYELLAALAFCVSLEELHINNYLTVANHETAESEPFVLAHLSSIVIHDLPQNIVRLLSHLRLPRIAVAHLSANVTKSSIDEGNAVPALTSILTRSVHALDVISLDAQEIRMSVLPAGILAIALAANGRHARVEDFVDLSDASTRLKTYALTVESIGSIFNVMVANVTKLVITGDFSSSVMSTEYYAHGTTAIAGAISPALDRATESNVRLSSSEQSIVPLSSRPPVPKWLAMLSQFASLRSLCIVDQGHATPPESFAIALAGTATLACCSRLEDLRLEGVAYDKAFFGRMAQSLADRRERCTRLRKLEVVLCTSAWGGVAEGVKHTFLGCVDSVEVEFA